MPSSNIFHWMDGHGWIVLSGGVSDDVRALALARASADGAIAYTQLGSGTTAEKALDDMGALGARSGYIVDVTTEDDASITAQLSEASLVVVEAMPNADEARSALVGAANDGILAAHEKGAVVLVEGLTAMAFGAWVVKADGSLVEGLEWLSGAVVAPGVTSAVEWGRVLLEAQPAAFIVGIGAAAAIAFGPDGQIEVWGDGQISVALGHNYTTGDSKA